MKINKDNMEQDEFENYVKQLDDNIEDVTTCLARDNETGEKQHGVVLTIKGVDVVLLQSDLEEIIDFLDNERILDDDGNL